MKKKSVEASIHGDNVPLDNEQFIKSFVKMIRAARSQVRVKKGQALGPSTGVIKLDAHVICECGKAIPHDQAHMDEEGLWQCGKGVDCEEE